MGGRGWVQVLKRFKESAQTKVVLMTGTGRGGALDATAFGATLSPEPFALTLHVSRRAIGGVNNGSSPFDFNGQ